MGKRLKILLMISIASAGSLSVAAQSRNTSQSPVKPQIPVEAAETQPVAENPGSISGSSLSLGGGYFMAGSSMGRYLKPSWSAEFRAQKNNLSGTLFGIGFESTYSDLKDKNGEGGMSYIVFLPHFTATFSFLGWFEVQGKGGAGVTALMSKMYGKKSTDGAFTLGCGGGIARCFGGHFITGIEYDYYNFFQQTNSNASNASLYMGYKF